MLSKTQKNFRKQMDAYKKDADSNSREQVYSYIEKDMISSYYTQKSKRFYKKPFVSVPFIMFLLYIVYSMYGHMVPNGVVPVGDMRLGTNAQRISIKDSSEDAAFRKQQTAVSQYLNQINELNLSVNEVIESYNKATSDFDNGLLTEKGLIENLQQVEHRAEEIFLKLGDVEIPTDNTNVLTYYDVQLEKFKLQYEIMQNAVVLYRTKDNKYQAEHERLRSRIMELQEKGNGLMLDIFDDFKYDYKANESGGYTYSY